MDLPEQIPGGRAINASRVRELRRHIDKVGTHPEDGKGHIQGDQGQNDCETSVIYMYRPLQEVDRDDDTRERERQPEHE